MTEQAHWLSGTRPFSINGVSLLGRAGLVKEASGVVIRATGLSSRIGELCRLRDRQGLDRDAEVIGVSDESAVLMPYGGIEGIGIDTEVYPTAKAVEISVGKGLVGRVVDAQGKPIDSKGAVGGGERRTLYAPSANPLERARIREPFATGVRAIDGFATVGVGQRVGIFAPAGVGKSVLLGMLARNCVADVRVIALIGERGREVREFLEDNLSYEGLGKSTVVVATADASPIERSRAAFVATAIAEYYAEQGMRVLLLVDSITRFARAQREIGLARGEPPTRRGFPPSLFTTLPQIFERAGTTARGAITAFYTVLMEDDTIPDPVAEEVRSLLDGHLVLSRDLAARSIYPAMDPLASLSRLMSLVASGEHVAAATKARSLLSRYAEAKLLVQVGEYRRGNDPETDEALDRIKDIEAFQRQPLEGAPQFKDTVAQLIRATGYGGSAR